MATQADYEAVVSLEEKYRDFKITSRDLPTTQGRFEQYLSDHNISVKHFRFILLLLLMILPVATVVFFFLNNSAITAIRANAQVQYESDLYRELTR